MSQSTVERERYEARQKYLHDVATWQNELARARAKEEQGRAELEQAHAREEQARAEKEQARGEALRHLMGRIHLCERLLHRAQTDQEQLRQLPSEELERLAVKLEAELTSSLSRDS